MSGSRSNGVVRGAGPPLQSGKPFDRLLLGAALVILRSESLRERARRWRGRGSRPASTDGRSNRDWRHLFGVLGFCVSSPPARRRPAAATCKDGERGAPWGGAELRALVSPMLAKFQAAQLPKSRVSCAHFWRMRFSRGEVALWCTASVSSLWRQTQRGYCKHGGARGPALRRSTAVRCWSTAALEPQVATFENVARNHADLGVLVGDRPCFEGRLAIFARLALPHLHPVLPTSYRSSVMPCISSRILAALDQAISSCEISSSRWVRGFQLCGGGSILFACPWRFAARHDPAARSGGATGWS